MAPGLVALLAMAGGIAVTVRAGEGAGTSLQGAAQTSSDDRETELRIPGVRESDGVPVNLDTTVYLPATTPAPAVLLGHGFGGSKADMEPMGRALAARGFVAVAWTARGFGDSGGKIHLDAPGFEVKDASLIVDFLAGRSEVTQDASGDPRVGVMGASYGGGLALLLAGTDDRVDAVAAGITWNDLRQSLFPQFAARGTQSTPAGLTPLEQSGVFKKAWTGQLLGSAVGRAATGGTQANGGSATNVDPRIAAACGRLDLEICQGYAQAAETGRPSARMLELLGASSPATVLKNIKAPTFLVQGQTDSLFPLSEADANARGIAANGTPVAVRWFTGGHDGDANLPADIQDQLGTWFDHYLGRADPDPALPVAGFAVSVADGTVSSVDQTVGTQERVRPGDEGEPGLPGGGALTTEALPLERGSKRVVSPPGAYPASLTALPGLGTLLGRAAGLTGGLGSGLAILPGESAVFRTAPLTEPLTVVGGSRVALTLTSTATDATLFVSLADEAPDGTIALPASLVAPVRVATTPDRPQRIEVATPGIVRDVPAGHRLLFVVSSTDQAYTLPVDARLYTVDLAEGAALTVPTTDVVAVAADGGPPLGLIALAMLAVTAAGTLLALLLSRRRRRADDRIPGEEGLADVPLAITVLSKAYKNGFQAVTDLSFRVEAGQVLGLLGPNGAGKTTTLRMLMGLILPTEGEIRVFGRRIRPGAPVLSRIGAFVEGPGFLPHLSGEQNLRLYWAATGRPWDHAHFEEALEVAGLGPDLQRTVRTYSQGMRQRLAIAQAMLGLPDLLVLDEPTNGLDPPQIREMREVLRRYAATGRTVVVSSHLLAEVEQTCTDVVVMHHGKLVAQGPVAQIVGASGQLAVDVDDPARAAAVARTVPGIGEVTTNDTQLLVHSPNGAGPDLVEALVRGGVRVGMVAPRRGLEEAFLDLVGRD